MVFRGLVRKVRSFRRPAQRDLAPVPSVGDPAPTRPRVAGGKPRVIVFLRHIGCAFGEATLDRLEAAARAHPEVEFLAITHGREEIATDWCEEIGLGTIKLEGAGDSIEWCHDVTETGIRVFVDPDRTLYAEWGLGRAGWLHLLHPRVTIGSIRAMLAGFRDRTTSGNRWQQSGMFAVDAGGTVRSAHVARTADDLPNIEIALSFLDTSQVDEQSADDALDIIDVEEVWDGPDLGLDAVAPRSTRDETAEPRQVQPEGGDTRSDGTPS